MNLGNAIVLIFYQYFETFRLFAKTIQSDIKGLIEAAGVGKPPCIRWEAYRNFVQKILYRKKICFWEKS